MTLHATDSFGMTELLWLEEMHLYLQCNNLVGVMYRSSSLVGTERIYYSIFAVGTSCIILVISLNVEGVMYFSMQS